MPNPENVIGKGRPFKAGEEQSKIARQGALASAAARRRKTTTKKAWQAVLASMPVLDERKMADLERMGADLTSVDMQTLIGFALAARASKGDVRAAQYLLAVTGNDPETNTAREKVKIERDRFDFATKHMSEIQARSAVEVVRIVDDVPTVPSITVEDATGGDDGH